MNTTQHTSGPWIRKGDWIHGMPGSGASQGIAQILGNCGCKKTVEANARLISAAPDMLDALQAVCDACGDQDSLIMMQARAALAKAKGQSDE
jgi:hypothetical protein